MWMYQNNEELWVVDRASDKIKPHKILYIKVDS